MENSLNENVNRLRKIMGLNENIDVTVDEANDPGYLSWKRKNVTIRGVKEVGEENNAGAMLGRGLYTAFLSNKALAKEYGTVYFVLNAIPKNPKVFNTLNEWEIWFYNTLVNQYSKEKGKNYPDRRDFDANTTIEDEVQKMGFDGIIIKGREMVNFNPPDNVIYFKNEDQLINYYETVVNGLNEGVSRYRTDMDPETMIKRVPFLKTFNNFSDKEKIMFQKVTYTKDVELYVKDSEPLFFKQFNLSSELHYTVVDMGDNRHRFSLSLVHQTWLMPPDVKDREQELTYRVLTMAMKKQMESFDYRFDEVLEQDALTEEQWNQIINKLNESFFKLENYLEDVLPVRLEPHLDENEEMLNEYIRHRGDKWVVVSKKGKTLGTHDTKQDALSQLRAIEANKHMEEGNDSLLTEKLTDVDDDVNMLYDMFFKKGVEDIQRTNRISSRTFEQTDVDTSILKNELCVKAHELNPCKIMINKGNNFYKPGESIISIAANLQAANFVISQYDGDLNRAADALEPPQSIMIKKEYTEERIKGSIHHELAHWIDDTFNNQHLKKRIEKNLALNSAGEALPFDKVTVNAHYMEIQAQIHNIKQLHNKYADTWDTLSFDEMIGMSPSLYNTYRSLPYSLKTQWVKKLKMRMFREGLLGKRMFN